MPLEQTVYNVDMTCDSCVQSVKSALSSVAGCDKFDIDLQNKRVSVEGTAPPSHIIQAIQDTGRDVIIRGTGKPNSAAVAILESFDPKDNAEPVRGLARIVATNDSRLLVDITLNGVDPGTYKPSFRASGNISNGALSTGKSIFDFGSIEVGPSSAGQSFESANLGIHELIGRSFVVQKEGSELKEALAGVIARSAGVWENDKQVCSCSGKTVWQERQDAHKQGLKI